eukprot:XP_001707110.1 Hypothetical protein GL50803_99213 [Giardia lamblia ATCC 50803]
MPDNYHATADKDLYDLAGHTSAVNIKVRVDSAYLTQQR